LLPVRGLIKRLEAVEFSFAGERGAHNGHFISRRCYLCFQWDGAQLYLLKLAATVERLLKLHQLEFTAQIILIDRLVTAAAALENRPSTDHSEKQKVCSKLCSENNACLVFE
jgi:hypothetical protein